MKVRYWGPKEFMIHEGAEDLDQMAILLAGKVLIRKRVLKGGGDIFEQVAELVGPTFVGEDSFFTGLKRSASVYARERVAGIVIEREDFNRLMSLDKIRGASFMKHVVQTNLQRAERTLVLYISSLQIVMNKASLSQCEFYNSIDEFRADMPDKNADIDEWKKSATKIMLIIRELNQALEELYHFANLPDIRLISVDGDRFGLSPNHGFYSIMKAMIDELSQTQSLISLDTINLKDTIISSVIADQQQQGVSMIDYPAIISIATDVHREISNNYKSLGFDARAIVSHDTANKADDDYSNLLWQDAD